MKITKSQLKQIIREEASRLKKQTEGFEDFIDDLKENNIFELFTHRVNGGWTNMFSITPKNDAIKFSIIDTNYSPKISSIYHPDDSDEKELGSVVIKRNDFTSSAEAMKKVQEVFDRILNKHIEDESWRFDEEEHDKYHDFSEDLYKSLENFMYVLKTHDCEGYPHFNGVGQVDFQLDEELEMSDIDDMSIEDKAVFSAMNDEEVEDDLSDIIAKYTKQGGDYEGGYKDDVSVSPGYLSESNKKGKMKITKSQLKQIIREEVKNQNLKRYSLHKYLLDNDVCEDVSFLSLLDWGVEAIKQDKDKVWNYFENLQTDKLEKIVNTHKEYVDGDYSNEQGDLAGEMGLRYSDSLSDEEKEGITIVDKGYDNIQSKGIEPYKRKTNYAKNKEAERIKREKFASEFPEEWRKGEDDMFYYIGKGAWNFKTDEVIPVGDGTFEDAPEAIERYRKPDYVSWKNEINENKMKITKSQLKEIIREEASRLKKQYILEDKKKAITEELRMLNENEMRDNDSSHRDTTSDTSYQDNWDNNQDMDMGDDDLPPEILAKYKARDTSEAEKAAFEKARNYTIKNGRVEENPEGLYSLGDYGDAAKGAAEALEDNSFRAEVIQAYKHTEKQPNFAYGRHAASGMISIAHRTNNPEVLRALMHVMIGALK